MREGKQNRQKENDWYSVKNKDNLSDMSDNQCIRRRIHDKTKRFEVQKISKSKSRSLEEFR